MPIRKFKPTTAGQRFQTVQTFDEITADSPYRPDRKSTRLNSSH